VEILQGGESHAVGPGAFHPVLDEGVVVAVRICGIILFRRCTLLEWGIRFGFGFYQEAQVVDDFKIGLRGSKSGFVVVTGTGFQKSGSFSRTIVRLPVLRVFGVVVFIVRCTRNQQSSGEDSVCFIYAI